MGNQAACGFSTWNSDMEFAAEHQVGADLAQAAVQALPRTEACDRLRREDPSPLRARGLERATGDSSRASRLEIQYTLSHL